MKKKSSKQPLVVGCVLLGLLIILGSLQVVFSPHTFVRVVMLISVIGCSAGLGAFIREFFILREKNQLNH
ncbi:hypothetical protein ACFYKX_04475 [Cytobacillus sp. FJAT-54145]|uniref:Uncharacterized protein n=1 Tax=Cytobacillus spartinae TaxID=3299023 RepID=A0ABW6K6T6_9BACI